MTTTADRKIEIEYIDMVRHDSTSSDSNSSARRHGEEDDSWLSGLRQLIKEYMMSEPDVGRVSNESEAFVLIEEETGGEAMQTEEELPAAVEEEEVFALTVTSEESSVSLATETEPKENGVAAEKKIERKRSTTNINLSQEDMDDNKAKRAISGRLAQFQKACQKENDPTQSPTRGGSKRLDLAKYQPMGGDGENKRASVTKRLDTARFSKFQGDGTDSAAASPARVTRNFTISPATRKAHSQKPAAVTTTKNSQCVVCNKTVYSMEKITADGVSYHKTCFRCRECNRCLSLGNFAQSKQFLYCKPHFAQLFKMKGNYDDAFDGSSRALRGMAKPDSGTHRK